MSATLAEVFQTFGAEYLDTHGLAAPQAKVFRAGLDCRTAALGGYCLECDACGHRDYVYHSSRNRHCPNCQTRAKEEWSRRRMAELPPVPYAHLVFTLPHDLNPLAAVHNRWVYNTLMACVSATLSKFALNPRWLGAEPAFTLVLYTWTQDVTLFSGRLNHVSTPLIDILIVAQSLTNIYLTGTVNTNPVAMDHLTPMRQPSRHPANGK